jgi:hypothetical protein
VFTTDAEKCHLTVPNDAEQVHIRHVQEPAPSLPHSFVQVLKVHVVLQTEAACLQNLFTSSVVNIRLAALLLHCSVCLDNYIVWRVCRIEGLRMTLLGLPDAAHDGSTLLPNLRTIYQSTLYSVPTNLNVKPDIEVCINEILCLQ